MIYSLKKITLIFIKILKKEIKLKFGLPQNIEIFVYNSDSIKFLENVLEKREYVVIDLRLNQLREIYISFKLFLIILKNIFKFNLSKNYFYGVLKIVKPKILITSCDNHKDFFELAKLLDTDIKFMAVQNANRSDYILNNHDFNKKIVKKNYNKEFYIPYFFCFSQNEIDNCNLYNIKVNKFYKIGSISTANFFYYINKSQKKIEKNKFDICLISEPEVGINKRYKIEGAEEGFGLVANYTIEFARKFNYRLIFASKRLKVSEPNSKAIYNQELLYNSELNFYKKYLNKNNFDYLMKNLNPKENFFSSYFAIFQSKVAVATYTTLLRDKIGVGEKILSCNLTQSSLFDFPLNGICSIQKCSYQEFEQRLKKIMTISSDEYFKEIEKDRKYIMEFNGDYGAINFIKNELDEILMNNKNI